jgi:hypothetical protein
MGSGLFVWRTEFFGIEMGVGKNRIFIIVLAGVFYDSLAIIAGALRFMRIQGMEKRDRRREDNGRRSKNHGRRHKNISEETKTMVGTLK